MVCVEVAGVHGRPAGGFGFLRQRTAAEIAAQKRWEERIEAERRAAPWGHCQQHGLCFPLKEGCGCDYECEETDWITVTYEQAVEIRTARQAARRAAKAQNKEPDTTPAQSQ